MKDMLFPFKRKHIYTVVSHHKIGLKKIIFLHLVEIEYSQLQLYFEMEIILYYLRRALFLGFGFFLQLFVRSFDYNDMISPKSVS